MICMNIGVTKNFHLTLFLFVFLSTPSFGAFRCTHALLLLEDWREINPQSQFARTLDSVQIVDIDEGLKVVADNSGHYAIENQGEIDGSRSYAKHLSDQGMYLVLFSKYKNLSIPGFDGIIYRGNVPIANYSHKESSARNLTRNIMEADFAARHANWAMESNLKGYAPELKQIFGFAHGNGPRKLQMVVSLRNGTFFNDQFGGKRIEAMKNRINNSPANIESITVIQSGQALHVTTLSAKWF